MGTVKFSLPVVGSFTSASGLEVTVRAATVGQLFALASASGDAAATAKATRALIDACAEIEGGATPSDVLTMADGRRVVELAQGDGSDFR